MRAENLGPEVNWQYDTGGTPAIEAWERTQRASHAPLPLPVGRLTTQARRLRESAPGPSPRRSAYGSLATEVTGETSMPARFGSTRTVAHGWHRQRSGRRHRARHPDR